jgi:hypothetical protein
MVGRSPLFLVLLAAVISIGVYLQYDPVHAERAALSIVEECKDALEYTLCYEDKIPALMDSGVSMESAFAIARLVQDMDPRYRYCHVLAHAISAKETARDLTKWKEVIVRAPPGVCGNGALHGAFQERFRRESMPEASVEEIHAELDGVCDARAEWAPTLIERSSCFHGLGHLSMYITDADMRKSIALCEAATGEGEGFLRTCLDGLFMQIFQPLEPEDEGLVENIVPTKEERLMFCNQFSSFAYTSCIKESWPLLRDEIVTPTGFLSICKTLHDPKEYQYCESGTVYVVFGMLEYDVKRMMPLCESLPESSATVCVSRAAVRFMETDWRYIPEAISVCTNASPKIQSACWDDVILYGSQSLKRGSEEAQNLCVAMPLEWRTRCEEVFEKQP